MGTHKEKSARSRTVGLFVFTCTCMLVVDVNIVKLMEKAKERIVLNDEQKSELISLWEGKEVLYNVKKRGIPL